MPHVSVTRLHLASVWTFPMFIGYSLAVGRQARKTPGFVGGWLGNDAEQGFWTCTVWESVEAMRAFRISGAHMKAMPKLLDWADEATLTNWEQPERTVPTPEAAYAHLEEGGTLSKLRTMSSRQQDGIRVGQTVPRIGKRLVPMERAQASATR